ncbi:PREDICTED: probable purine permease 11 isoform X1 [Ipomoea nil]|uniref:probable purine permease 11 isoform X1 n=1 Tax=Ipomoea nil TaxID=35883 RepID=UPI000901EAD9|nr:PREDICTED: probable purine permease 11 isoform X1 [Ipomoea nil]XP_019189217.1 PREDICTED: probable purine permease 11 isoform X1 [Ipomoea nil]XP_019189219.1 PREDICTED: probable purine permease 11 isoform X1 [Ipomoea nil]
MGEEQQRLLDNTSYEAVEFGGEIIKVSKSTDKGIDSSSINVNWKWWFEIAFHTVVTLSGLEATVLLSRIYYDQGGNSKWLMASIQTAGFPFLIPFIFFSKTHPNSSSSSSSSSSDPPPYSFLLLALVSTLLGLLVAATDVFYSLALEYLPASTYTLLNSSQLAFTALFSFLLNAQSFTPYIINSVIILTFSPMLLIFSPDTTSSSEVASNKDEYMLGVLYTIAASACPALIFSLTQLVFEKIIKRETIKDTMILTVLLSFVATVVTLVGLFASGEWKGLRREMEDYKQGVLAYNLVLFFSAVASQAYIVSSYTLTFKVSSLFSNVVIRLATPLTPLLSMLFLNEEMSGLKVMSLLLSVWGFASYIYQQYIDDLEATSKCTVKISDL